MAGEKTEQPTEKKLRDSRKKGQVSKSNDLTQAFLFMTAAAVLSFGGAAYVGALRREMTGYFTPEVLAGQVDAWRGVAMFGGSAMRALLLLAPLLGAMMIMSAALGYLQVQGLFAPETLKPKLDKLNPLEGFKNIFFKAKTYIELIKNLLKFTIVFWLAYVTLRGSLGDVLMTARTDPSQAGVLAARLMFSLLFRIGGVFVLIGAADYMLQKKLHMKNLMMTKEEVKQEYKESEGDPHIKHARKHLHEELLANNMIANVPKASVVVVNPTHLAVALEYNEATMAAPCVTARGANLVAEKIRDLARRNRVPVMRNIPLAHSLYEVELGREIPEDLYEAVAEVLNWVYQLTNQEGES